MSDDLDISYEGDSGHKDPVTLFDPVHRFRVNGQPRGVTISQEICEDLGVTGEVLAACHRKIREAHAAGTLGMQAIRVTKADLARGS